MGVPKPWVETHGYCVHDVAPRRILGRVCPLPHSRNRQNVRVLQANGKLSTTKNTKSTKMEFKGIHEAQSLT